MNQSFHLASLSDSDLVAQTRALVADERERTAVLLAHLAEVDARRLYAREAYSSLFEWCVRTLHMAEDATYKRIRAARAARAYPIIFEMVARGELHLSAVVLLAPHLTADSHAALLTAARHQSKRDIEILLASRF